MASPKKLEFTKTLKPIHPSQIQNFERGYYINQSEVARLLGTSSTWINKIRQKPDFPKPILVGKVAYWFKPKIEKYKKKKENNLHGKRNTNKPISMEKVVIQNIDKHEHLDIVTEENDYLITTADIARILGVGLTLVERMYTPGNVHYDPDFPNVIMVGSKFKKFSKVKFDKWFNKIKTNGRTIAKETKNVEAI